jgi:hypothetical protein
MTHQDTPPTDRQRRQRDVERFRSILQQLSMLQLRFIVARLESKTDIEACKTIMISPNTAKAWPNKAEVDEAVNLLRYDGMATALEIRRRSLAKAMAVKAAGLDSKNESVRQKTATELIEWCLGKATQRTEVAGPGGGAISVELFQRALDRAYEVKNDGDGGADD